MKVINNILKIRMFPVLGMLLCASLLLSCADDLPSGMDTSDKHTDLSAIRIVNAGEDGDEVLEGVIDENTKMITFPAMHPLTDFANLRLEAELSAGATLEQSVYNVVYPERVYTATALLKIINTPRTREYFVTFEQIAPPNGANFVDYELYDFSSNPLGAPRYHTFEARNTQNIGFDGERILIVPNSNAGTPPHILRLEDVRNGTPVPTNLKMTGVSGGLVFHWLSGYLVNGKVILSNLADANNPLKLYYYDDINATPQTILNMPTNTIPGGGAGFRIGDVMSASLTNSGNGFIYFADNTNTVTNNRSLVRVSVSNFTSVTNPTLINPQVGYGVIWDYFNRVGTSSSYLYTTHADPIVVVDANGATQYAMPAGILPVTASDPKIIEFNNSRYLIFVTAPTTGQIARVFIYDITSGDDTVEAIRNFSSAAIRNSVFEYTLGENAINGSPVVQVAFHVEKDEDGQDSKLVVVAAAANNGFAVFEFNKKEIGD